MKTMKTTLKKILAALLALLLPCMAVAEAPRGDLSDANALIDLTAAAAILDTDAPLLLTEGGVLPEAFVRHVFLLGPETYPTLGITASMRQDPIAQSIWLSAAYALDQGELTGVEADGTAYPYVGVVPMASTMSVDGNSAVVIGNMYSASGRIDTLPVEQAASVTWLDIRATVHLKKNDAAPGGWQVTSFTTGDEIETEAETADYFAGKMMEYLSTSLGMSVMYPAYFGDCTVEEAVNGMSVHKADGKASFSVYRNQRGSTESLESIAAELQAAGYTTTVLAEHGGVRGDKTDTNGRVTVRCILLSDTARYEATLEYDASLAAEFSLYATYMVNSFSADELGLG